MWEQNLQLRLIRFWEEWWVCACLRKLTGFIYKFKWEKTTLWQCRILQQSNSMDILHIFCSFVVLHAELAVLYGLLIFFSLSTVFRNLWVLVREVGIFFPHVYSSIQKWKLLARIPNFKDILCVAINLKCSQPNVVLF